MDLKELVSSLDELSKISSKIEKTQILIRVLENTAKEDIEYVILFLLGKLYPDHVSKELGISTNLLIKAMSKAYGHDVSKIESLWKEKGDLGVVGEELSKAKKQVSLLTKPLTLKEIFEKLRYVADLEGEGSLDKKVLVVSGLLMNAKGIEAKYVIRFILGDMRIGVAEGILRDALIGAYFAQFYWSSLLSDSSLGFTLDMAIKYWKGRRFLIAKEAKTSNAYVALAHKIGSEVKELPEKEIAEMKSFHKKEQGIDVVIVDSSDLGMGLRNRYTEMIDVAYALINDFPEIAILAYEKGEPALESINPVMFRPIRVMLAQKVRDVREAFEVVGRPAAFEYKFDGFRTQIHKKGDKVEIFTRRLENVTKQFPDVVAYIKKNLKCEECIVEGETIGYDKETKKWLPFQRISQRIRRKYEIDKVMKEIPVMTFLFDVIYHQGKRTIDLSFKERRKLLESIVNESDYELMLAKQIITEDEKEAERFYKESLDLGNEGIMAKNLHAKYVPGLRVGHMLKIKPTLETLDLTIISAEWGEGKRSGVLSSFELACLDPDTGEYLSIGKLGTGIKEKAEAGGVTFEELTERLKPYIIKEEGKKVYLKPAIVVEVAYEEIQRSPNYSSGFALRFPRLVRVRDDKSIEEVDDIHRVERIYAMQRHRSAS